MLLSSGPSIIPAGPRLALASLNVLATTPTGKSWAGAIPGWSKSVLALMWFRSNLTSIGNTINGFYGSSTAGSPFTQIGLWGNQSASAGTTGRAFVWAGYYNAAIIGSSSAFYFEARNSGGTANNYAGDPILALFHIFDWNGTVGASNGAGDDTTSQASYAASITPQDVGSLLVGCVGTWDNTQSPYSLSTPNGFDKVADTISGSGGADVDGSACFFTRQSPAASVAIGPTVAGAGSARTKWGFGMVELKSG